MIPATLEIRLLGKPALVHGGRTTERPRGRKTWALLAFLLLAADPPTRTRLSEVCFPSAEDPRGALRWSIADLNRVLAPVGSVTGDPVRVDLPAGASVDAWRILDRAPDSLDLCRRGELLEGLTFSTSEPLERWLGLERRRVSMACVEILTTERDRAAAAGDREQALALTADLVALDPYDDPVARTSARI